MYNHNKAQQSKNRVHISWDILYKVYCLNYTLNELQVNMKNADFGTSVLQCKRFFLQRVEINKYL